MYTILVPMLPHNSVAIAINEGYFCLEDKLSNYFDQFDYEILGEATIQLF